MPDFRTPGPAAAFALPVIDVGLLHSADLRDRQLVAAQIRDACVATGFFYVANHGIEAALEEQLFAAAKRFFDLPLADKERVNLRLSGIKRGYGGFGDQALDAKTGPDRKESITVGIDLPRDHPLVCAGTPLHGPNLWPQGLPGWRETVEAYFTAMERLARTLLDGIALSLELPWGYFDSCLVDHMSSVRMLHYPPHPTADPEREVGCGAHTDWGALTVLAQDDTGGLEVQHPSGAWIAATPRRGTYVVNIGDMMARWTNDLYASTPHRVLNRSERDRYSAAFFFDPAFHTRVECLPTCRSGGRPARYPAITSGEHLQAMFRKTYIHAG